MTTLYRCYDQADLLYVGIADDVTARLRQHAEKLWWQDVTHVEREEFRTREDALAAEKKAIQSEAPRFNRLHNPRGQAPLVVKSRQGGRPDFISLASAAAMLDCSVMTVRRRISDGSLTGYRVGPKSVRVSRKDVEDMLRPIPTVGSWPRN